jgi:hypothetical protein
LVWVPGEYRASIILFIIVSICTLAISYPEYLIPVPISTTCVLIVGRRMAKKIFIRLWPKKTSLNGCHLVPPNGSHIDAALIAS